MTKKEKINYEINMSGARDPLIGEVELKPCPFCGMKFDLSLINTHTASCWVECPCGAQMHGRYFSTDKGKSTLEHFKLSIESAKDHWNRRIK